VSGVLVDTSVWIAHFRRADATLQSLLERDQVLCHPLIVIEIACGTPPTPRNRTLADLRTLRLATVATSGEILAMIERERIPESGCGAVDAALLASTLLTPGAQLWTLDKPLAALANRRRVAFMIGG
jgi:predicted nucleic acid-binding protein